MTTYRKTERVACIVLVVMVVALGIACSGAYTQLGLGLRALAFVAGIALLPGLITVCHATMRRVADDERTLHGDAGDGDALFSGDRVDSMIRRRNLDQFETWIIPVGVGIIAVVELFSALYLLKVSSDLPLAEGRMIPAVAGSAGFSAVVLFLVGSYLVGLSYKGDQPILRAVAGELSGLAWLAGAYALLTLVRLTQLQIDVDGLYGRVLAIFLLIRAVERSLAVIMEIYRPRRVRDGSAGLLYESKLNAIVSDPQGLLGGMSDALHYQFGIRISEAGLLRLVTTGVPVILVCNVVFLLFFSCIVVINPGERAVVERLGECRDDLPILEPGLHGKLPWPIDTVYRRNVQQLRTVTVGVASDKARSLWTDEGVTDIELFLTPAERGDGGRSSSLNLLAVELFVQYRIKSLKDYIYQSKGPDVLLRSLARRELTDVLAGKPFFDAFLAQRDGICTAIKANLQTSVDAGSLGMSIVSVGVRYMQPPKPVVEPYQNVVASGEQRVIEVLNATREFNRLITEKKTERETILSDAKGFRDQRVSMARADAASFTRLLPLYRKHGRLMKARTYFAVMDKAKDRRKIIVATDTDHQLIRIDLKKTKSELFDFAEETPE